MSQESEIRNPPSEIDDSGEPLPFGKTGYFAGADTVTAATANLPEAQRLLIRWFHHHGFSQKLSYGELAEVSNIDKTMISRVFNGRYVFPAQTNENGVKKVHPKAGQPIGLESVCARIEKFKRLVERDRANQGAGFVETTTWQKVDWICERAYARQKMAFIFGPEQIGKSAALEERRRRNNGGQTILATMPPRVGQKSILVALAKAVGVNWNTNCDAITHAVHQALDRSKQLIVDECHRAFENATALQTVQAMDTLRDIFDLRGCSVVFCGTNVFRDNLKRGEFVSYMRQFRKRGALYELQLPSVPPKADLWLICEKFGLPKPSGDALEMFLHHAKHNGLGIIFARLVDAKIFAEKKKEPLTWDHVIETDAIITNMGLVETNPEY